MVRWELLSIDYVKINFEGSVRGKKAAVSYIIRNYAGKMIAGGVIKMREFIILIAEIIGLREGIKKVIEMGYMRLEIEGDNIIVI